MKKIFLIGLLLIAGPAISGTQQVPALFNFQGVLLDEGGNPLPDGISNLKFQISDSAGNVLYEETQDVDVARGQVSAIVGNGLNPLSGAPTGGIPSEAFDPTDTHYLQVEVAGQKPYDRLEIVATPYSLWADTALRLPDGAITSAMIGKGAIKKEHLDEELMEAIFPDGIPKGMLPKDTVYNDEFTSFRDTVQSVSGAGKVGVTNAFIYSGSQTVQGVLSDMDLAIKKRQEEVEFSKKDYQSKINFEAQTREESDDALQKNVDLEASARQTNDATLQSNINWVDTKNLDNAGDTINGTLTFGAGIAGNQITGTGWSVDSAGAMQTSGSLSVGSITSSGEIKTASSISAGSISTSGNINANGLLLVGTNQINAGGTSPLYVNYQSGNGLVVNDGTKEGYGPLTAGTTTVNGKMYLKSSSNNNAIYMNPEKTENNKAGSYGLINLKDSNGNTGIVIQASIPGEASKIKFENYTIPKISHGSFWGQTTLLQQDVYSCDISISGAQEIKVTEGIDRICTQVTYMGNNQWRMRCAAAGDGGDFAGGQDSCGTFIDSDFAHAAWGCKANYIMFCTAK